MKVFTNIENFSHFFTMFSIATYDRLRTVLQTLAHSHQNMQCPNLVGLQKFSIFRTELSGISVVRLKFQWTLVSLLLLICVLYKTCLFFHEGFFWLTVSWWQYSWNKAFSSCTDSQPSVCRRLLCFRFSELNCWVKSLVLVKLMELAKCRGLTRFFAYIRTNKSALNRTSWSTVFIIVLIFSGISKAFTEFRHMILLFIPSKHWFKSVLIDTSTEHTLPGSSQGIDAHQSTSLIQMWVLIIFRNCFPRKF